MATKQTEKKNYAKRDSYALAFKMIADALKYGCPLQAIAIEESILTDRLSSTLNVGSKGGEPCPTLGAALNKWKPSDSKMQPHSNSKLFDKEMDALYPQLDAWRKERNSLLHGLAKSIQGIGPDIPADIFLGRAMNAATEGLRLVNKVKAWTQKQVNHAKRGKTK